jgi:hypothetical protein
MLVSLQAALPRFGRDLRGSSERQPFLEEDAYYVATTEQRDHARTSIRAGRPTSDDTRRVTQACANVIRANPNYCSAWHVGAVTRFSRPVQSRDLSRPAVCAYIEGEEPRAGTASAVRIDRTRRIGAKTADHHTLGRGGHPPGRALALLLAPAAWSCDRSRRADRGRYAAAFRWASRNRTMSAVAACPVSA